MPHAAVLGLDGTAQGRCIAESAPQRRKAAPTGPIPAAEQGHSHCSLSEPQQDARRARALTRHPRAAAGPAGERGGRIAGACRTQEAAALPWRGGPWQRWGNAGAVTAGKTGGVCAGARCDAQEAAPGSTDHLLAVAGEQHLSRGTAEATPGSDRNATPGLMGPGKQHQSTLQQLLSPRRPHAPPESELAPGSESRRMQGLLSTADKDAMPAQRMLSPGKPAASLPSRQG